MNNNNNHILTFNLVQSSWKTRLRNRFKFLRSNRSASSKSSAKEPTQPPAKRSRRGGRYDPQIYLAEEYKEKVSLLQAEYKKKKKERDMGTIQNLMDDTYTGRRDWLRFKQPNVSEVIEEFPSLKSKRIVSNNHSELLLHTYITV